MYMRLILSLLISFQLFAEVEAEKKLYDIDGIIAIIYHKEGTEIILRSDLRPALDSERGEWQTPREVIAQRLMVLDAKSLKVTVSDDDVDRFIEQLQKMHSLTRADIESLFKSRGYTYEEGRQQLRYKQYIESAVEYRVKTNKKLIIGKQEIEEEYRKHPMVEEPRYTLQQGFIAGTLREAQVNDLIASGAAEKQTEWDEPFVVAQSELPADKKFLVHMPPGTFVAVEEVEGGWQITKLVEKTPEKILPLTPERERKIGMKLTQERGEELLKEYEESLITKATIRIIDPTINLAPQKLTQAPVAE